MPNQPLARIFARTVCLAFVCAWLPQSSAHAINEELQDRSGYGGPEDPIEVILPPELHAMLFHSLPIAGLIVTPDAIAERVLPDPRSRATASPPITGKGTADSIPESGAVDTRAEPPHRPLSATPGLP